MISVPPVPSPSPPRILRIAFKSSISNFEIDLWDCFVIPLTSLVAAFTFFIVVTVGLVYRYIRIRLKLLPV